MKLKMDYKRYTAPGKTPEETLDLFSVLLFIAVFFSLIFFIRLTNNLDDLYTRVGVERVIAEGAVMKDFAKIVAPCLFGFYAVAFGIICSIVKRYLYYYTGSMSIYLMKRLPSRFEIHERCLVLPILGALTCLAIAFVTMLIYFGIYMMAVPDVCLAPDQWAKIWR